MVYLVADDFGRLGRA
jgi:hypothetical protein